jgi:hypothetical protein
LKSLYWICIKPIQAGEPIVTQELHFLKVLLARCAFYYSNSPVFSSDAIAAGTLTFDYAAQRCFCAAVFSR